MMKTTAKQKALKRLAKILTAYIFITLISILFYGETSAAGLPVFPGAEGFGTTTTAGSGRHLSPPETTVYRVTNLNAEGPGSLKACIIGDSNKGKEDDPRVCIFEVSGYIDITGSILRVYKPYLTIAGQTAPSPGITIKGGPLEILTHDVLIQHMRIRVGDDPDGFRAENRDGLMLYGPLSNVVIDHSSISWAVDENISVVNKVSDITISNSIISGGLGNSLHPKGFHSKGLLVMPGYNNISIIKNLFAHNYERNPLMQGDGTSVILNNFIYNPGHAVGFEGPSNKAAVKSSIVGNYIDVSMEEDYSKWFSKKVLLYKSLPEGSELYFDDNDPGEVYIQGQTDPRVEYKPVWYEGLKVLNSYEVEEFVLKNAGARPTDRDMVDERIMNDVVSRTGEMVDCVESYGDLLYGSVQGAAPYTLVLDNDETVYPKKFIGMKIEVDDGYGNVQVRTITSYDSVLKTVTVDSEWETIPDVLSNYRIINDCTKNAGGWPELQENYRALTIPDAPNDDDDGDGYTNLEEWLNDFALEVEGVVCTDNDGDGYAAEGGRCGEVDCDDSDETVNPGGEEICGDGIDNNCDNVVDEEICTAPVYDAVIDSITEAAQSTDTGSVTTSDSAGNTDAGSNYAVLIHAIVNEDNFNDGDNNGWSDVSGIWAVKNGEYSGYSREGEIAISTVTSSMTEEWLTIEADMSSEPSGNGMPGNLFIIFDYRSPVDFKFAGIRDGADYWVIGYYDGSWHDIARTYENIDALNWWYRIKVEIDNNTVRLYGDFNFKTEAVFEEIGSGRFGIAVQNGQSHIDDFYFSTIQ
jgi:hypothetical protein